MSIEHSNPVDGERRTCAEPEFEAVEMRVPQGWFAWLVPLLPLPVSARQRLQYRSVLAKLIDRLRGARELAVFLELAELHKENVIRNIGANGMLWAPEMGLGVAPDQPPPKLWTYAELTEMSKDSPFPSLIRSVAYLDAQEEGKRNAVETMCGTGGLVQVVHAPAVEQMMAEWTRVLLQPIEEEAMRGYPFYIPLLSGHALRHCTGEDLERWLGAAYAYVRESATDQGLLVLAREPLQEALTAAGVNVAGRMA